MPSAKLGEEKITDSSKEDFVGASNISLQAVTDKIVAASAAIFIIRFLAFKLKIHI